MTVKWRAGHTSRCRVDLVLVVGGQPSGEEHWKAEVKRLTAQEVLLRAEIADLKGMVAALSEKVATLAKLLFGKKTEKQKKTEPDADDAAEDPDSSLPNDDTKRRRGQKPGSKGHGRRDYSDLDTEEHIHDVPEDERVCPKCGANYEPFGEETSEQVDWQVRLVRTVHRRPTYRRTCRCKVPGVIVAQVPPKVIRKGLFSAMFLARLLTEKYVLGRPLERIVTALASDGLDVATGTLVGVISACSVLLAPLDKAIRVRNAAAVHLHIDETSWSVFETLGDKTNHNFWLWVFIGADTTVFSIDPTRSTEVLRQHLGIDLKATALEAGRRLLVSSDFYGAYQSIAKLDGVDPLYCWAHIRRYFIRAAISHKCLAGWAAAWLELIGALYVTHRALAGFEVGTKEHARVLKAFESALGRIDRTSKREAEDPGLHYKVYEVLATLDHEWDGLSRHIEFPELPLDNNAAERMLRNPVVGRKNYYGSGSLKAAEAAGRIWTITATSERAGWNPLTYLCAYLEACARNGSRPLAGKALDAFLPWIAKAADHERFKAPPNGPAP